jgi:hypothetical protein
MPDAERVRLEIGFDGGQIMSSLVTNASANALDQALADAGKTTFALDSAEGPITIVLAHVAYVKRTPREGQIGFLAS